MKTVESILTAPTRRCGPAGLPRTPPRRKKGPRKCSTRTWSRRFYVGLTLGFSLVVAPALAQTDSPQGEAQEPAGFFVDTVDVSVVNVEVYVTDKSGERISGLTRDDFQIFEDGREVRISNFYEVTERRRRSHSSAGLDELSPREAPDQIERIGDDQKLHMVVYIDNANIEPFHRNNVFTFLRGFLGTSLAEGDLVSVYTYEKALHLRQDFTTNHGLLNDALREIEGLSAHGVTKVKERDEMLRDIERARSRQEIEGRVRNVRRVDRQRPRLHDRCDQGDRRHARRAAGAARRSSTSAMGCRCDPRRTSTPRSPSSSLIRRR